MSQLSVCTLTDCVQLLHDLVVLGKNDAGECLQVVICIATGEVDAAVSEVMSEVMVTAAELLLMRCGRAL